MIKTFFTHYRSHLLLAYPVVLSQAGHMMVVIADNIMVGKIGTMPLASASFANSIYSNILVFVLGVSIGITPLVGMASGEQNHEKVRSWLKHGLALIVSLSVLITMVLLASTPLLGKMGQDEEVAREAIPYFVTLVWSTIPLAIFFSLKQFAEGLSSTKPAMYLTILSNLVNIGFNYLLIYGEFGFPQMGLVGAGYATLLSRVVMAAGMCYVVWQMPEVKGAVAGFWTSALEKPLLVELSKLGFPIGGQIVIEVGCFSVGAVMIGWIGAAELAAHQIVISVAALTYMMANGLSAATTIRASNFLGAGDVNNMRLAVHTSIHLVLTFMAISTVLIAISRWEIPALYSKDAAVIGISAALLLIACLFQFFDGLQVVALGALRGLKDVRIPTIIVIFSYWIAGVPSSYLLGFVFGFGVDGVWFGYLVGLGTAGLLLHLRIQWLFRKGGIYANT